MSQWTHVNASIRFDAIKGLTPLPDEKSLGRICKYDDEDWKHWETTIIPCGSEGSLEYKIIENSNPSHMAAMVVVIWGDLRDYDNVDEIMDYFSIITSGMLIRSGVLEIDVEGESSNYYYSFNSQSEEWEHINEHENMI